MLEPHIVDSSFLLLSVSVCGVGAALGVVLAWRSQQYSPPPRYIDRRRMPRPA